MERRELEIRVKYAEKPTPIINSQNLGKQFNEPVIPEGLAIDFSTNNIYLSDLHSGQIIVFSSEGDRLFSFCKNTNRRGRVSRHYCIAIYNNLVYVSNRESHCISVFNLNGGFVTEFGEEGKELNQLTSPEGLSVHQATGDLYVCETNLNQSLRIHVLSKEHPYHFHKNLKFCPRSVQFSDEFIYVYYKNSSYLYMYDYQYSFVRKILKGGVRPANYYEYFCLDAFNNIIIAHWGSSRISILNPEGEVVHEVNEDVDMPCAIAMDGNGRIIIASFREDYVLQYLDYSIVHA